MIWRSLKLTFDDATLDDEFRRQNDVEAQPLARVIGILGIAVFVGLHFFDLHNDATFAARVKVLAFWTLPLLTLATAHTFTRDAWKRFQWACAGAAVLAFGGTEALYLFVAPDVPEAYLARSTVLLPMIFHTCLKLRFRTSLVASLTYTTIILSAVVLSHFGTTLELVRMTMFFLITNTVGGIVAFRLERSARLDYLKSRQLAAAMEKSEDLLLNILPRSVAEKLKERRPDQETLAEQFDSATVLFADIVNFTALSAQIGPEALISLLNGIFSRFDRLAEECGVEKIKTIGDAYMAVAGLPERCDDHAPRIARLALQLQDVVKTFNTSHGYKLDVRIGINTGPVIAGVIGRRRFIYDLWGDTVNMASRMESHGAPGAVQVTESTAKLLADEFVLEERGVVEIKHRGTMRTYWLKAEKAVPRDLPASGKNLRRSPQKAA